MSMYPPHIPFTRLTATTLDVSTTPRPAASQSVIDGLSRGRCGIEVVNTSSATVYIGASDVSAQTGLPIEAGEKRYFPVTLGARQALYIAADAAASVVLAEYFA